MSQYALTDHPHDDLATKAYVDTELGKKANTHSHPYASSNHTHSGGGAVTLKHGSSTFGSRTTVLTVAISGLLGTGGMTGTKSKRLLLGSCTN